MTILFSHFHIAHESYSIYNFWNGQSLDKYLFFWINRMQLINDEMFPLSLAIILKLELFFDTPRGI